MVQINSEVHHSLKWYASKFAYNVSSCVVWLVGYYTSSSPIPVIVSCVRGLSAPQEPSSPLSISQDLSFVFSIVPGGLQVVGLFLFADKSIGGETKALENFVKTQKDILVDIFSFGSSEKIHDDSQIVLLTCKKSLQMTEFDEVFFYSTEFKNIKEPNLTRIPQENVQDIPPEELATKLKEMFFLLRVNIDLDLSIVFPDGEYKQKLLETATPLLENLQKNNQLIVSVKPNIFISANDQKEKQVLDSLAPLRSGGKVEWLDSTTLLNVSPSEKLPAKISIEQSKGPYRHTHTNTTTSILYFLSPSLSHGNFLEHLSSLLFFQVSKTIALMTSGPNVSPTTFHFMPSKFPHPITLVYPTDKTISPENDDYLAQFRATCHRQLLLPMDRPALRYYNQLLFSSSSPTLPSPAPNPLENDYRLKDVHLQLQLDEGTATGGTKYLVQGSYLYYHYQQDMNDNGWGCAYRSLQTLCSWMVLQGFSAKPIPTHADIQRILVELGDKEKKFIGSTEWIGSQEVFYCLDYLYGVSAKILNVSSGAEIAQKGEELSRHFKTEGTPVMIGGGVLAYTLLGVDYNASSGAIKFLILDPHYVGPESLKNIKDKWCSWKEGNIFKKDAHYNMCMPLRPKKV